MDEWMNGSHSYKLWGLGRPRRQRLALPPTPQKQTIMPTVTSYLSIRTAVFLKSFRFWLKTTNLFLFDGLSSLQTAPLHLVISVGWEIFFGGSWFMRMSTKPKQNQMNGSNENRTHEWEWFHLLFSASARISNLKQEKQTEILAEWVIIQTHHFHSVWYWRDLLRASDSAHLLPLVECDDLFSHQLSHSLYSWGELRP